MIVSQNVLHGWRALLGAVAMTLPCAALQAQSQSLDQDPAPLAVPASASNPTSPVSSPAPPLPPEEPFTSQVFVPDLAERNEAEFLIGPAPEPLPVENIPPDSAPNASETEGTHREFVKEAPSAFSFGDFLGDVLALGTSPDPDSKDRFRIGTSLRGGYDSNVLASSTDQIGTLFTTAGLSVAYSVGSPRFEFSLTGSGGATLYENRPGRKIDYNGRLDLIGSYRFTRRFAANASLGLAYLSQPDPGLEGGTNSFQGDFLVTDGTLNLAYSLSPTLLIRPAYRLNSIRYQDTQVNEDSGFTSQTFSLTTEWLVRATTTLTVDYRYNPVTYFLAGEGSEGQIVTVGIIQQFSPRFTFTFQGGAEYRILQNPEESGSTNYLGPFAKGDLEYQFAPGSLITGTMRYGTEPSGTGGVTIRRTFRASLAVEHSISGRWILQAGIIYENSYYDQPDIIPDITQDTYFGYVGVRYRVSNAFSLNLRYDYTSLFSTAELGDYDRGVSSVGMEFAF